MSRAYLITRDRKGGLVFGLSPELTPTAAETNEQWQFFSRVVVPVWKDLATAFSNMAVMGDACSTIRTLKRPEVRAPAPLFRVLLGVQGQSLYKGTAKNPS